MCHMRSSASSKPASGRQFVPLASRLIRPASIFAALLLGAGIALRGFPSGAESARLIPPPMLDEPANPQATAGVTSAMDHRDRVDLTVLAATDVVDDGQKVSNAQVDGKNYDMATGLRWRGL